MTKLEQWAEKVIDYSSQYDDDPNSWAAAAACGEPRVYPRHGDIRGAWAQKAGNYTDNEYIVLKYAKPVEVSDIHIYETLNAGAVCKVSVKDTSGLWHTLYQATPEKITSARILKVTAKDVDYTTDTVRLEIDCTKAGTHCEIDAVKLIGTYEEPEGKMGRPVELWAKSVVQFSSQYNTDPNSWAAAAALGKPRVYPRHGDIHGAWAQSQFTENEYIILKYAYPIHVSGLEIYETYNAGAVWKVSVQDTINKEWHTLYEAQSQHMSQSRCLKIDTEITEFTADIVKLQLDCTQAESYCEIDAVKLIGEKPFDFEEDNRVEMWGAEILSFSSQYDSSPDSWAAAAALGEPRVYPRHGDIRGAWAQGKRSSDEYIVIKYDEPVYLEQIEIYETYNPGAVVKVSVLETEEEEWHDLYTSTPVHIKTSRILKIEKEESDPYIKTDTVRVQVNCTAAGTWCEIDAVKLVGIRNRVDPAMAKTLLYSLWYFKSR